jgi:uncharacterized membrane protein
MKKTAKLFLSLAVISLSACSTVTVSTDYDHKASFAKYKTYGMAPASKGQTLSPSGEAALSDALRSGLAAKGIHQTTSGKPDLAVARIVFLHQKTSVQQYTDWGYGSNGAWPYGYGYYNMWSGAPRTYVDVNQYTEGTMILDFVDTHTGKLVFRGTGKAVVGGPESNAHKIREAVEKIVAGFPAGASR